MDRPTHSTADLMMVARDLLREIYRPGYRYKKTGVQLTNLVAEEEFQPSLFDQKKPGRIDVDKIVDEINKRLGDPKNPVITRASQGTIVSGKGWRMRSERHSPGYTTDWNQLPEANV